MKEDVIEHIKDYLKSATIGKSYDVIIVGGGIAGAAAAVAIGPLHKVLVLDKNPEWTSVFGNSGAFFLNVAMRSPLFRIANLGSG